VGDRAEAEQVGAGLERGRPGGFEVKHYADVGAARRAVRDRDVYAAYVPGATSARLLYAGANGPSVTSTVTGAFTAVGQAQGDRVEAEDIVPASHGDSRSTSVFYAAFGVVLAGFLFGLMTYQIAPRLQYRRRMTSLALFSVLGGILVALITSSLGFGALPGSVASHAGIIALMAAAVGGATMVCIRLFGKAGMSVASVTLLTFGNATSGGTLPSAFLPAWLHPLSEILPVGVGVRALQGVTHFHNDGLVVGVVVLGCWILLSAGMIFWRDVHVPRRRDRTAAHGAGHRGAAVG
jgi:hypothetical protein